MIKHNTLLFILAAFNWNTMKRKAFTSRYSWIHQCVSKICTGIQFAFENPCNKNLAFRNYIEVVSRQLCDDVYMLECLRWRHLHLLSPNVPGMKKQFRRSMAHVTRALRGMLDYLPYWLSCRLPTARNRPLLYKLT